jgi:hypothetical protein
MRCDGMGEDEMHDIVVDIVDCMNDDDEQMMNVLISIFDLLPTSNFQLRRGVLQDVTLPQLT